MHPLFQNKFVRLGLVAIGALISLFIVLFVLTNLSSNSLGLKGDTVGVGYAPMAPSYQNSMGRDALLGGDEGMIVQTESSFYYAPEPLPDGYTSGLESYETTNYSISARTKEFDALCGALAALKNDPQIHFKNLTSSINSCYATFYVAPEKVEGTLHTLTAFGGVEVNRNTESVTRHKQQLESQTAILQQQLARVESSLTAAQTQLDRLNQVFNSSDEVTRLSGEVTKSLQYIDQLTERKIRLIGQLDDLYQQSADLAERMTVVEFAVNVSRATPLVIDKYERQWDHAWEDLKDTFTDTLIGLTAVFSIFLLWTIRVVLYLLVLLVVVRGLWKFAKVVWNRW